MTLELVPACGRSYDTKAQAVEAWNAGKDFADPSPFRGGTYANRETLEQLGHKQVLLRYGRPTKVALLKRKRDGSWK